MPSIAQTTLFFVLARAILAAPAPFPQSNNANNAYSGAGGNSKGGDVVTPSSLPHSGLISSLAGGTLLNVASNNAGKGGPATSGDSFSGFRNGTSPDGSASEAGNSYSGSGGNSQGGTTSGSGALINLGSNNAGNGGDASSGRAGAAGPVVPIYHQSASHRTSRMIRINID